MGISRGVSQCDIMDVVKSQYVAHYYYVYTDSYQEYTLINELINDYELKIILRCAWCNASPVNPLKLHLMKTPKIPVQCVTEQQSRFRCELVRAGRVSYLTGPLRITFYIKWILNICDVTQENFNYSLPVFWKLKTEKLETENVKLKT